MGVVTNLTRLGESISDVLARWEQLLQMVIESDPSFLAVLTEEMLNDLAFSGVPDLKNNSYSEGLYMWLDHMLTSSQWESSRRLFSFAYVNAVCDGSPNHWTELLQDRLRKTRPAPASTPSVQSKDEGQAPKSDSGPVKEDSNTLKKYGWEFPDTWDSRPLGVV